MNFYRDPGNAPTFPGKWASMFKEATVKRDSLSALVVLALLFLFTDPRFQFDGSALALRAQDLPVGKPAPSAVLKFEVASIRECSGNERSASSTSPTSLILGCWPLSRLIADAYETFADGKVDPLKPPIPLPLEGAPDWVKSTNYTINAKPDAPRSGAMMRGPMMQALLEDRFHLRTHRETREVAAYIMTVARGGLKLRPTPEGSCKHVDPTDLAQTGTAVKERWCVVPTGAWKGNRMIFDVHGVSLTVFARFLHPNGRPVIDQTGVTGLFDIHLEWETEAANSPRVEDGAASDPSPHASDIRAMREQLGLRLDPGRGKREIFVIDHVERPSGN